MFGSNEYMRNSGFNFNLEKQQGLLFKQKALNTATRILTASKEMGFGALERRKQSLNQTTTGSLNQVLGPLQM